MSERNTAPREFTLKPLSKNGIDAALTKAEQYRPAAGRARVVPAHPRTRPRRCTSQDGTRKRGDFHVVGAVEKHAAAQHRLAARHGAGQ